MGSWGSAGAGGGAAYQTEDEARDEDEGAHVDHDQQGAHQKDQDTVERHGLMISSIQRVFGKHSELFQCMLASGGNPERICMMPQQLFAPAARRSIMEGAES